jgi:hypothetical protein
MADMRINDLVKSESHMAFNAGNNKTTFEITKKMV